MTNVIIIANSLIPSVLLCGHSQLEHLKEKGIIDYKFVSIPYINTEILSWADIVIFIRSESKLEAYTSKICKKANKHMIYILDDDLLNTPDYLSSSPYYHRQDIQENIETIMSNCDTFMTSSPVMLEKYGPRFKNAFNIHEPSLNVISKKKKNKKIKVGFAGSIDRAKDINEILDSSLRMIINKYGKNIDIEFMGAKPDIVDEFGLTYIPYKQTYDEYTEIIKERNWDIGLAPMPESAFHECKYFNKYVEYASFGIAGIYSNVKPYTFGIKNNFNGLLVNNDTNSWYKAMERLIEDDELRNNICKNCLEEANNTYSLEVLADDYLAKITNNYIQPSERTRVQDLFLSKLKSYVSLLLYKIKEQKLYFPIWVIKKAIKIIKRESNEI